VLGEGEGLSFQLRKRTAPFQQTHASKPLFPIPAFMATITGQKIYYSSIFPSLSPNVHE